MTLRFSGNLTKSVASGGASIGLITSWDDVKVGSTITGTAPMGVVFDLCDTTDPSTTKPFRHLLYHHDFGEVTGETWAVSGMTKDEDYGPIVAHTYETPGTYTYTVTVTDIDGNTTTETLTVVVDDPDVVFSGANTICYSSSGDFTGAPSGATQVTSNDWRAAAGAVADGKRVLLRRGDTFVQTAGGSASIPSGTVKAHLGAFGIGAKPIIDISLVNTNSYGLSMSRCTDIRVQDLSFIGGGLVGMNGVRLSAFTALANKQERILLKDLETRVVATAFYIQIWPENVTIDKYNEGIILDGCIGVDIGTVAGENTARNALLLSGHRFVINGCDITKKLGNSLQIGEHAFRCFHPSRMAMNHTRLKNAADTKHLVKWHINTSILPKSIVDYVHCSMCDFQGATAWPLSIGPQTDDKDELVRNILFDGCVFRESPDATPSGPNHVQVHMKMQASEATIRNCIFLGTDQRGIDIDQRGVSPAPIPYDVEILNCTAFFDETGGTKIISLIDSGGGMVFSNLLMGAPNSSDGNIIATGLPYDGSNNLSIERDTAYVSSAVFATYPPTDRTHVRLLAGTPPVDAGDSTRHIWRDAENRTRGATPNIGAQENI